MALSGHFRFFIEMENEIWKPVKGYEEFIEVSNLGNVRRKAHSFIKTNGRWCHVRACELKPHKTKRGYVLVKIKCSKMISLHRLVATTFIPNPLNLPEVNHKDENKENNRVDNLEWCTHQYNSSYGTRNSRIKQTLTEKPNNGKPISQYTKDGVFVKTYSSIRDAVEKTGINDIYLCFKGKIKYAGGFVWRRKFE